MLPAYIASAYRNRSTSAESEHVDRSLRAARIEHAPFPHAVIRNFLPAPLFEAVRADFPASSDGLQSIKERRRDAGYSDKRYSQVLPAPTAVETAALSGSLRTLQQVLTCERTVTRLLSMFIDVVAPHLGDLRSEIGVEHVPIRTGIELIYDRSGFALVPHTDGYGKLITGLLYFGEPEDPPELGTRLYEAIDPDFSSDGQSPVARDRLREARLAPYEPNLFLCFARSGRSFHGVEPSASDRPRRLVQYSILVT